MNRKIRELCRCALFTAIICICSMITIPLSPIPVNLALFALLLTAFLLPANESVISTAVYISLGVIGLPVFAGMQGGIGVIAGPTGGFIIGYIPFVVCISLLKGDGNSLLKNCVALFVGYTLCYLIGGVWLATVTGSVSPAASIVSILPFIPADIMKAACALILVKKIKGLV